MHTNRIRQHSGGIPNTRLEIVGFPPPCPEAGKHLLNGVKEGRVQWAAGSYREGKRWVAMESRFGPEQSGGKIVPDDNASRPLCVHAAPSAVTALCNAVYRCEHVGRLART